MKIINRFFIAKQVKWIVGVLGLVAIVLIYFTYSQLSHSQANYITERVQIGDIEKTITSLGNLQPKDYVDVGAQVSGQLKKVYVEVGDSVQKGQLLAEIDPTVYATKVDADRASLVDLRAQLMGQRSQLNLHEKTYQRNRALAAAGALSQKELDEARSAYHEAKASVDSLYAQIKKAQSTLSGDIANLSYTKIYAPTAGTVVAQTVLEGQTINSSQTAPTLLRIANLNIMTLNAQVAESDVPNLKVGMPVYFTTLGHQDRRWQSTIKQIMPTPTITNNVVLYTVLIDVDNPDGRLMTQMTAQVFFVQGQAKNLPIVSIHALKKISDGKYQLQVVTERGLETRQVAIALMNRNQAAIAKGVKAGDTVVVERPAKIRKNTNQMTSYMPGLSPKN